MEHCAAPLTSFHQESGQRENLGNLVGCKVVALFLPNTHASSTGNNFFHSNSHWFIPDKRISILASYHLSKIQRVKRLRIGFSSSLPLMALLSSSITPRWEQTRHYSEWCWWKIKSADKVTALKQSEKTLTTTFVFFMVHQFRTVSATIPIMRWSSDSNSILPFLDATDSCHRLISALQEGTLRDITSFEMSSAQKRTGIFCVLSISSNMFTGHQYH